MPGGLPQAAEPSGLKVKNDSNNVSLDRESRLLAENALRFNKEAQLLKSQVDVVPQRQSARKKDEQPARSSLDRRLGNGRPPYTRRGSGSKIWRMRKPPAPRRGPCQRIEYARKFAEQRKVMLEAQRRIKLLERWEERRHAEWKAAHDRELDEIAAESFLANWEHSAITESPSRAPGRSATIFQPLPLRATR